MKSYQKETKRLAKSKKAHIFQLLKSIYTYTHNFTYIIFIIMRRVFVLARYLISFSFVCWHSKQRNKLVARCHCCCCYVWDNSFRCNRLPLQLISEKNALLNFIVYLFPSVRLCCSSIFSKFIWVYVGR